MQLETSAIFCEKIATENSCFDFLHPVSYIDQNFITSGQSLKFGVQQQAFAKINVFFFNFRKRGGSFKKGRKRLPTFLILCLRTFMSYPNFLWHVKSHENLNISIISQAMFVWNLIHFMQTNSLSWLNDTFFMKCELFISHTHPDKTQECRKPVSAFFEIYFKNWKLKI